MSAGSKLPRWNLNSVYASFDAPEYIRDKELLAEHANKLLIQLEQPWPEDASQAAQLAESVSRSMVGRTVADVERDLILETLDHVLGNRTHAANILGISIRTLRNKLNQYTDEGTFVPGPGEVRKNVA